MSGAGSVKATLSQVKLVRRRFHQSSTGRACHGGRDAWQHLRPAWFHLQLVHLCGLCPTGDRHVLSQSV